VGDKIHDGGEDAPAMSNQQPNAESQQRPSVKRGLLASGHVALRRRLR
jgi:hypothetical protein